MIQTPLFLPQLMEDKMQIMMVFLTDMKEVLVRIQTIGTTDDDGVSDGWQYPQRDESVNWNLTIDILSTSAKASVWR